MINHLIQSNRPVYNSPVSKEIIIRAKLDVETHKRLRVKAAREGLTRQEWVRQAILAKLKSAKPPEVSQEVPDAQL